MSDVSFLPLTATLALFTKAVGQEVSWFDGCFCHELQLGTSDTSRKRKKVLMKAYSTGKCPWTRKRLCAMVMGRAKEICQRVTAARSAAHAEVILSAPPQVASRMLVIEEGLKSAWNAEVREKWAPYEHIPYTVAATKSLCLAGVQQPQPPPPLLDIPGGVQWQPQPPPPPPALAGVQQPQPPPGPRALTTKQLTDTNDPIKQ